MQENVQPTPQTVIAYKKVILEQEGLGLEIDKLKNFLKNPKPISDRMKEAMLSQLKDMKSYYVSLEIRLAIFEEEYPDIKTYDFVTTIGEVIIGNFNPNDLDTVAEIKNRSKQLINCIDNFGKDKRRKAIAVTKIEEAQMMAVKSLFH